MSGIANQYTHEQAAAIFDEWRKLNEKIDSFDFEHGDRSVLILDIMIAQAKVTDVLAAAVQNIEQSVDDLLHGRAGETDVTVRVEEPELHVRTNHKVTAKGWRLDETGVTWTGRGVPDWRAINTEMVNAFVHGQEETARRNSIPGVVTDAS